MDSDLGINQDTTGNGLRVALHLAFIYSSRIHEYAIVLCDTAKFGIDPIPSKYRASIADTNTDTFYYHLPLCMGAQCIIIY